MFIGIYEILKKLYVTFPPSFNSILEFTTFDAKSISDEWSSAFVLHIIVKAFALSFGSISLSLNEPIIIVLPCSFTNRTIICDKGYIYIHTVWI